MAKVNFYLLKQDSLQAVLALCCKLAEQQARQGQQVFILADSGETAQDMDRLLWSFTPDSFVPHVLAGDALAGQTEVIIGVSATDAGNATCILNLGTEPVAVHAGLNAIAEFVPNDETAKAQSRVRWNHYKQLGHELQLHQL
ncbi:MAG TPA: DNA polymerase III subunit chi [Candidatus Acidoferrum sp.]|nr:DNA polymerase III subunit chi [Candidatus Acidoferrum sp.]